MYVLGAFEPKEVLRYFESICDLPHGSKNTKLLSDFCAIFAKMRGLEVYQDKANNVLIRKEAYPGYENHPTVILQGHLDMVCEKDPGVTIDFLKDGLTIQVEDGMISAKGTTLGGDDGIAVAYCLALLDSKNIPHPPLEVLLTTDEEIGMLGAAQFDTKQLKGKTLINIDSEQEGILTCGCAGGVRSTLSLPIRYEHLNGVQYTLTLTGLVGGHSGVEIHKGHPNAAIELMKFYDSFADEYKARLVSFKAPGKDNAISREATLSFMVKSDLPDAFFETSAEFQAKLQETDPDASLGISFKKASANAFTKETQDKARKLFAQIPNGVQSMSKAIPTLVQTSLNLGVVNCEKSLQLTFALRSSVNQEKLALASNLKSIIYKLGGQYSEMGAYPAWEYREKSHLRDVMMACYKDLYKRDPQVDIIHAGLECGLFSSKIQGLDCVSFGPDMQDIHTPKEALSISSVERTWNYLLAILKAL